MSDTPRADAAAPDWASSANLASELEIALAAVTAERDKMWSALDRLLDLTKARMRNLEANPEWPQLEHIKELRDAIDTAHDALYGKEAA